jgi:threonine aldolase
VENTVNKGGGACWTEDQMAKVSDAAKGNGIPTHLDGARLWNALVTTGQNPQIFGKYFHSISVCFSKGLGCPVGSVLVGDKDFIYHAHRHRKRLGGGMRQAGILAAACIYALENNVDRLAKDHENARKVSEILRQLDWVKEVMPVETNIVLFQVENASRADRIIAELKNYDIHAIATGGGWIRFVFHMDISAEDTNLLIQRLPGISA